MRPLFLYLFVFGTFSASVPAAELLPVRINGLEKNKMLEQVVRRAVALPEAEGKGVTVSEGRLGYYVSNINRLVEDSLEPLGYYHSVVSSRMERDGALAQIIIDVAPGEPVKVRDVALQVDGDGSKDRFIGFWLEGFEPVQGEVFNHGLYEENKAQISQALLDRGYFDMRNSVHEVRVTRAAQSADINLAWDSGIRYRYGNVRFEGHEFETGLLEQLVNFEPGNYYSQPQINRLQESLAKLNYFSSIEIVPDLESKQAGTIPVLVSLTQGKRTSQYASFRYGTKTGLGVEYGVERRWINRRGHKLDFNVGWAQNEQSFTTLYRIPAFQWLDGWYGIGLVTRNEEYTSASSRYVEGSFSRSGELRNWDLLASLNVRRERFDEAIPDIDQSLGNNLYTAVAYPEFNAVWRRSDDLLYPTSGSAWYFQARSGYEFAQSQAPFLQVTVKNKNIRGLGNKSRLLMRGELGATWSANYPYFPPSLRFYAGGDQSVRGYGYKEIGEYFDKYNLGGRYMAVGSIEYEYRVNTEWAAAGFIDVGDAFDRKPNANFGVGAGARWRSPIGPVRFDVAYGFNGPDPGFGIHFTIGSDL
jgi:translocation and assembly module TamA